MTMQPYRVLVMTSDLRLGALRGFAHLFSKYWGDTVPVIIGGFSSPGFALPPNFRFLSLGSFSDYPISKWSDALIKALRYLGDPIIIIMLELSLRAAIRIRRPLRPDC